MRRKVLVFVIFTFGFLFLSVRGTFAQVNGDKVGPELPDPQAGQKVICDKGFTGTVAVLNRVTDTPHNTAPCAHVILRVDLQAGDAVPPYTSAVQFAQKLNAGSDFPAGTLVVFGIELNNLDQGAWGTPGGDIKQAAINYAGIFIAFAQTLHQSGKYKVAPSTVDYYNSVYSGTTWTDAFASAPGHPCSYADTLAADIFKLPGVADWETKYVYMENACGKSVSHFEGWGTDPKASIADQIAFLKTEPLPGGINTATTLIVNNCKGFGGSGIGGANTPWLYWIPKFPDKVWNADGTEFDYKTCTSVGGPTPVPFETKDEVPCSTYPFGPSTTTDPEFHSLRPYPASPCYKKVDETTLMCANDLIVKKTYNLSSSGGAGQCPAADGCTVVATIVSQDASGGNTTKCDYTCLQLHNQVWMDLSTAKLPIVGNTEDVPNGTWQSPNTNAPNLTAAQRMNYYVSWYLNGVVYRAEEDFSGFDPNSLVNYSGPINKLMPWTAQFTDRITSINNANSTPSKAPTFDANSRHNQIAGCDLYVGGIANLAAIIPCYLSNAVIGDILNGVPNDLAGIILKLTIGRANNRLEDWNSHMPPLENDPKYADNFQAYWKDYLQWRGNLCSPQLFSYLFVCANLSSGFQIYSLLFRYIPSSNTEDRVGEVFTDSGNLAYTRQLPLGQGNGATIANVNFKPDNPADTDLAARHNLFFAHMQEDSELARLLQSTFATKSQDPGFDWEKELAAGIASQNNAPKYVGAGCVIQKPSEGPPGDKLYGNIDRTPTDPGVPDPTHRVGGALYYDATFSCTFVTTIGLGTSCYNDCIFNGGDPTICSAGCTVIKTSPNPCSVDIYASLGIYTKTPKAYELWQRLVGCEAGAANQNDPQMGPAAQCNGSGGMSIFKRFYPKAGVDSVLTTIKSIPAVTTVSYKSDASGTYAGTTGTSGEQAKIYFPYLGSMEEYFLNGIQKALRPLGMNSAPLPGQSSPSTSPTPVPTPVGVAIACPGPKSIAPGATDPTCNFEANCDIGAADPGAPWDALKVTTQQAVNWIVGISDPKTVGSQVSRCFNDVVDQSLKAGVNPIYSLAIWVQESAASNRMKFGCGLQDFGVNSSSFPGFESQLSHFLELPFDYPNKKPLDFSGCFQGGQCSLDGFSQIFKNGSCPIDSSGTAYANKTIVTMQRVAPNCDLPVYPTQMTTCH